MLKRIVIPILISAFIIVGIVIFYVAQATTAPTKQPKMQIPSSKPVLLQSPASTSIPLLTPIKLSTNTPQVKADPTSTSDVKVDPNVMIVKMKTLANHFSSAHLIPGWIHLSNEYYSDNDNGSGAGLPKAYIKEEYYHLDDNKLAFEMVSFMKTLDGKIVQASVLKNNVLKNLTFNFDSNVTRFTPELDGGVVKDFSRLLPIITKINMETTTLNTEPVTLFDAYINYDKPLKFDTYNQPVVGMQKKAYFNSDGKLVQPEVYYTLQDGTQRWDGTDNQFIVESGIILLPEIQKYLQ